MDDFTLLLDMDLTIVACSRDSRQYCGYAASDLVGRDVRTLLSPETARQIHPLQTNSTEAAMGFEGEVVLSGGGQTPVWITADLLDTSKGAQILLSTYDLVQHKLADVERSMHSRLLAETHDALIVRDLEDRICFWNEGAERLYGWQADEATGENFYDLLFPGQGGLAQPGDTLADTGKWSGELRQITKARQVIIVESRWRLHRDVTGTPNFVLIANRDVTEKKALEKEIVRTQRMESIGLIAGAIAHDLNNVLSTMLISVHGTRREHAHGSSESRAEEATRLITQVLSLAKDVEDEPTSISLGQLIAGTAGILNGAFPKSIHIKTEVAADLRAIIGNATHLYHVLLNLCLNAREAMPSGGTLTIAAGNGVLEDSGHLKLSEAERRGYVFVKVSDTGVGIPAEITGKIFEPFFTTRKDGKGTGLGLFSVARIVRNHGGFIDFSSEPGRGTQFIACFPAETANS